MPDQAEPMTDRLGRFTPNALGLDRDAILFAAGQCSARGSRVWKGLVAVLMVSQVFTLVLLWPATPNAIVVTPGPANERPASEFVIPPRTDSPDVWSAGSPPEVVQDEKRKNDSGEFVTSPTLTIWSAYRFD